MIHTAAQPQRRRLRLGRHAHALYASLRHTAATCDTVAHGAGEGCAGERGVLQVDAWRVVKAVLLRLIARHWRVRVQQLAYREYVGAATLHAGTLVLGITGRRGAHVTHGRLVVGERHCDHLVL